MFARDQAGVVAPTRPFVSILLRSDSPELRSGERSYAGLQELWRVQVDDTTDGDYEVDVSGVTHTFTASGDTMTGIRDGLVTALGSSTTSTTTAQATRSLDILGDAVRGRLLTEIRSPAPAGMQLFRLRGNIAKITRNETEPILELFCWGLFDQDDPGPEDYGEDMAEQLAAAFLCTHENRFLRDVGFIPNTARVRDSDRLLDGEQETIGICEIRLGTTMCHVTDLADTTAAQFECTGEN